MKSNTIIAIIAAAFVTLLATCANQSTPGGGPVDKTPPELSAAFPADGQVNVPLRAQIRVTFSEWINTGGVSRAVSVYPRLPQGVTVKASKNRIVITPKVPLNENTTYHVVIGTALRDLRGNAIERPINIVFSTGASLDSGQVFGKIHTLDRVGAPPMVGLYIDDGEWEDTKYFAAPDYMTQSDSAGAFEFSHLRTGDYRMVAFVDQYRIGRLHAGDTCYTSREQIIKITNEAQRVNLYPAISDTAKIELDSAAADSLEIDAVTDTSVIDTLQTETDSLIQESASIVDSVTVDTLETDSIAVDTLAQDSVTTRQRAEQICYRLSGGASCLPHNENRKWTFRLQGQGRGAAATSFTVRDSAGTFAFDSIPAGRGTLLWFIDDDGNDSLTFGRLIPFSPPEEFFVVPGVIEAKANWEIVDLEVDACESDE